METLTLRPAKKKWLRILLVSGLFVVCAGWMIGQGQAPLGWCGVLLFSLGVLLSTAMLIPGLNGLSLTQEGFSLKTLGRTPDVWKIKWRHVANFAVLDLHDRGAPIEMVAINFTDTARAEFPPARVAKMDGQQRKYGCDGAFPDTYGLSADELVTLLNQWRSRHSTS